MLQHQVAGQSIQWHLSHTEVVLQSAVKILYNEISTKLGQSDLLSSVDAIHMEGWERQYPNLGEIWCQMPSMEPHFIPMLQRSIRAMLLESTAHILITLSVKMSWAVWFPWESHWLMHYICAWHFLITNVLCLQLHNDMSAFTKLNHDHLQMDR